ncbi:S-methyl-5-thioribose kinase [Pseudoruegeria sp. HB172150]|uniref:S-methyl-5-thioribose kinase n=1 Tax=Pseudoruegeria sp. HB172150 TaxID=2721164 RepID=UPI001555D086|nr:S-methyl-5-thioribose kinase [Pseudoruegeria sp. HB172150]
MSYEALSTHSLAARLGSLPVMTDRLGNPSGWIVREVGDGNLNLVFIVESRAGGVIVKQALPYVRLVGESWPLPLRRSYFEFNALVRQAERDPGSVPEIYHFDEEQALVVMEYLTSHIILRQGLIEGRRYYELGKRLGLFCARTLFGGSDLSLPASEKKSDLALFAGNVELCDITENLVFTDPYYEAEMNRHTDGLERIVASLRSDRALKIAAQELKMAFTSRGETMLHGDLHTGSVMVSETDTRVIDPEFAVYGPMGFDIGMLIANFLMASLSQPGHGADRGAYAEWILEEAQIIWNTFAEEFSRLWRSERTGILYPASLYEDQGQPEASETALSRLLNAIWRDALGFCGIECHRRILGLAHNADFELISDERMRASCEARALALGRDLVLRRDDIADISEVQRMARHIATEEAL